MLECDATGEDTGGGEPDWAADAVSDFYGDAEGVDTVGEVTECDATGDDTGGGDPDWGADAVSDFYGDAAGVDTGDFEATDDFLDDDTFDFYDSTLGDDFEVLIDDF